MNNVSQECNDAEQDATAVTVKRASFLSLFRYIKLGASAELIQHVANRGCALRDMDSACR